MLAITVGRFQVAWLTAGHRSLLDKVQQQGRLVVLIGVDDRKDLNRNPLDYTERASMIQEAYPSAIIKPIYDVGNNEIWSEQLDAIIDNLKDEHGEKYAGLFGSRDSFLQSYCGNNGTQFVIPEKHHESGTMQRERIRKIARNM